MSDSFVGFCEILYRTMSYKNRLDKDYLIGRVEGVTQRESVRLFSIK